MLRFFFRKPASTPVLMLLLLGCLLLNLVRCVSLPEIYPADQLPAYVRKISHIRIYANRDKVDTGIELRKGDLFSIAAEGEIHLWPGDYARPLPTLYFGKFIGSEYLGSVFGHERGGTYISHLPGRLYLGIKERYLSDNTGYYDAIIIAWNTNNWSEISAFLYGLKLKMPEHLGVIDASEEASARNLIEIAKDKTSKDIEATRQQIEVMRTTPNESVAVDSQQHLKALEIRHAELIAKMAFLDELTRQLQEQRVKVSELRRKLEEMESREKILLGKISEAAKTPPRLLITEPEDESRHDTEAVRLSGAIEDDRGIERLEILINGQHAKNDKDRSLKPGSGEAPRGLNFERTLFLSPGSNRIRVRALDTDGLISEKIITVHYTPNRRNVWAVIVGINDYPKLPRLKYAISDAAEFHRLLLEKNRIPAENIFLLLNEQATLSNLRSVLGTHLRASAAKNDMVIIFFAGHGATERDALSVDGDGLEKYLLTWEADAKDLYSTAIPMREIAYIFARIQSERLVFIADACYSGASGGRTVSSTGMRAGIADTFLDRIAAGRGKIIITASAANEVSVEKDELQHGVFTYYLLEGLEGAADTDRDGTVTVDEVYRYVSEKVPQATGQEQHPVKKGSVEGNLVLSIAR
jgi:Caspase domain